MITRALAVVLLASSAFAVSFTAVANGDWQSTATWGTSGSGCHVAYPCMTDASNSGDTVNLSTRAVTCSTGETCSYGTSPAADLTACNGADLQGGTGAQLIVQNGATFIYAGPACIQSGNLNFQAGSAIYHDSSWAATPVGYSFTDRQTGASTAVWCIGSVSPGCAAPAAGSPRVIWNGDSFYSPKRNPAGCTTADPTGSTGCVSGHLGGSQPTTGITNDGQITAYNWTLANVGAGANDAWVSSAVSGQDDLLRGLIVYNSGSIQLRARGRNITLDKSFITSTTSTQLAGGQCLRLIQSTTAGIVYITNSWIECGFSTGPVYAYGVTRWTNSLCKLPWSGGVGFSANSGNNYRLCSAGGGGGDLGINDQVLWYGDAWNTGAAMITSGPAPSALSTRPNVPWAITNSVIWGNYTTVITHAQRYQHPFIQFVAGSWVPADNINGSLGQSGSTAATEAGQNSMPGGGTPSSGPFTLTAFGNINLCGWQGFASVGNFVVQVNNDINGTFVPTDGLNYYQNSACASTPSLGTGASNDGMAAIEAYNIPLNTMNVTANIFFRNDRPLGSGSVVEIQATSNKPQFTTTPPFHNVNYNAVWNGKVADQNAPPCSTFWPACSWVSNPPTPATEFMVPATAPPMVDAVRSVPLFSEYLNASGLFPYAQYAVPQLIDQGYTSCTTNYRGAFSLGTTYNPCDVVYVDSTVAGYSGAYEGRRTYWIAKLAHTSSNLNQPVIGYDTNAKFVGPTPYWEDAWLTMWLKPQLLSGATFVDGSLPAMYSSSTMYAIGLLNTWIRQGYKTTDPRLWAGKCSKDQGATFVECGAMPLPAVQHIPPAGMNF